MRDFIPLNTAGTMERLERYDNCEFAGDLNNGRLLYALVSSNLLLILANLEIFESLIRPHEISESSAYPR
jgi:hypothetical protein